MLEHGTRYKSLTNNQIAELRSEMNRLLQHNRREIMRAVMNQISWRRGSGSGGAFDLYDATITSINTSTLTCTIDGDTGQTVYCYRESGVDMDDDIWPLIDTGDNIPVFKKGDGDWQCIWFFAQNIYCGYVI